MIIKTFVVLLVNLFSNELDSNFQILKEYFLKCLWYSQYHSYKHVTLINLTWHVNIFSTVFLNLNQKLANILYRRKWCKYFVLCKSYSQLHPCSTRIAYIPLKLYLPK